MNLLRCLGNRLMLRGSGMDVMNLSGRHCRGQGPPAEVGSSKEENTQSVRKRKRPSWLDWAT